MCSSDLEEPTRKAAEPVREQCSVREGVPSRAERESSPQSGLRRVLNVGCTTKRQNGSRERNFFGMAARKFPNSAEGTRKGGKAADIFFAEAKTSCNAEAESISKRKRGPPGLRDDGFYKTTPKTRKRFEPNRRTKCAIVPRKSEYCTKGGAAVRLPG